PCGKSSSARRVPPRPWWPWPPSPSPNGSSKSKPSLSCEPGEFVTDINPYIFRAYDVRGKVGIDILPEVFSEVGRAYGTLVRRRGGRTVAIGMDNRTTSPPLKEAFAKGI